MKRCCMNCIHEYLPGGIDPCYSCTGMPGLPYFDAKAPPKPITNADRLRKMTDEELAEFISGKGRTFGEEYEGYMSALEWLRKEADNG